jgi:Acyl-CoA dehydrogenase, C-terminal domain
MTLMLARSVEPGRTPFGKNLKDHDLFLAQIADLRMEIESARLLVLNAADMIDRAGAKGALRQIAMAKAHTHSIPVLTVRSWSRRSLDVCLTGRSRFLVRRGCVRIN